MQSLLKLPKYDDVAGRHGAARIDRIMCSLGKTSKQPVKMHVDANNL